MKDEKVFFLGIEFEIIRRRVSYPRIIYRTRSSRIILPPRMDPIAMLQQNQGRIEKKILRFNREVEESQKLEVFEYEDQEFEKLLKHLLQSHAGYLDITVGLIKFRKMRRRWGTCYSDGKIILNTALKKLPEDLISFILFHELLHLNILSHSREFKETMKERFPDYKEKRYKLRLYGLLLLDQ